MNDKYSQMDELTTLGFMVNALGGGGDRGQSFPRSDAEDLSQGLRFIPGEVTVARRRGKQVEFVQDCSNCCCWYWQFEDGSRTYYWERGNWEAIAAENGVELETDGYSSKTGNAGLCPFCGNQHTGGGYIAATEKED